TDVLLRVAAVGVCGTDMHYYKHGRIGTQTVSYPFTIGHECGAIVEEVGTAVTRVKPGDRVAVDPAHGCMTCDQCQAGRFNTCRQVRFLGSPASEDGCLAEYIVTSEHCCFPIRDQTSFIQAAYVEPLSIGVYSVEQAGLLDEARVGILGAGSIGLNVLLVAKEKGAAQTYITDPLDYRLDVARSLGAGWTGNPDKVNIVNEILDQEPQQLDAVFECCGEQTAVDQALELLKPGGRLIIVGSLLGEQVAFTVDLLRRKEISIFNIRRQSQFTQAALDLIEQGKVDTSALITHTFDFQDAKEAFELAVAYADGVIKASIIMP
ncbi:MAG: alcohol dehydrogenase catalytic domain-containing protein, partial [Fidelibacterota bacterium]